jgi:hypothetical protein
MQEGVERFERLERFEPERSDIPMFDRGLHPWLV